MHSRYDYLGFRGRLGGRLPEPNVLPFALHRERLVGGGEGLVVCRWSDEAFPLRTWVESPQIGDDVQDEFSPRDPEEYVAAARRAMQKWEGAIGRPVRFARAASAAEADLVVRMTAVARSEDVAGVGLGVVRDLGASCRVIGPEAVPVHVEIEYAVAET